MTRGARTVRMLPGAAAPYLLFILFCGLLLAGCSTLKTASLRDAAVLAEGSQEFSLEASGTEELGLTLALLERDRDPDLGRLADSLMYTGPNAREHAEGVLWGFSYARGLGDGWEVHGGLNLPLLRGGAWVGDIGAKKRLYTGERTLVSGYGRAGLGYTGSDFTVATDAGVKENGYRAEASTAEGELALIAQWRATQRLSFYANAGPSAATIRWSLEDRSPHPVDYREGTTTTLGIKNRLGFVVEFEHSEVLGELGLSVFDRGMVPSLGIRQAWKTGWKQ